MRLESLNENLWDGGSFISKDCATTREKCKLIPEMHGSVYEGRAKEQGIIVGGKNEVGEPKRESLGRWVIHKQGLRNNTRKVLVDTRNA